MKQLPEQSLTLRQEQTNLIGDYLCKLAIIEGRNRVVDEELTALFVDALDDIPLKRLERGFKEYLKEGDRFPWPSQVRDLSEL